MAAFSESEIHEAKERVRRMKQRASAYIDAEEKEEKNGFPPKPEPPPAQKPETKANEQEREQEQEQEQSFIILMLILLLSHEGADNSLILALLYLLF